MRQQRATRLHQRGAALIFVVVVIAALVAIGFPFLISMRLAEKSAQGFKATVQSQQLADGARALAVARLARSHPDEERRARLARGDAVSDDEGSDDLRELRVELPPRLAGRVSLNDPRATQAFAEAVDLRSRLDPHTCGPLPLANLLGASALTDPVRWKETKRLPVREPRRFYSDGDPETWDGLVRVGREWIAYKHRTEKGLEGLLRAVYLTYATDHAAGTPVRDARAWKLADDPTLRHLRSWRRYGSLARFQAVSEVRRIADWQLGARRLERFLIALGPQVGARKLRAWGASERDLEDAGLDPTVLGARTPDEALSPDLRAARDAAERWLRKHDLSVKTTRRHYGEPALPWQVRSLAALSGRRLKEALLLRRGRLQAMAKRRARVDAPTRAWVVKQVRKLARLRREAPHLETLGRLDLERLRPFLTVAAPTEGGRWSAPLPALGETTRTALILEDTRRFARGWVVQVRPRDGRLPEYRRVASVTRGQVTVDPPLDFEYTERQVDVRCQQPTPLNVRTASREVLVACLWGLSSQTGGRTRDGRQVGAAVTEAQAQTIAAALIARPPASHAELRARLLALRQAKQIDDHAVDAVFRNAVDPADAVLLTRSVPFCYRSGDVYEVTATGIVNSPAGMEVVKTTYRDTLLVAPPRPLTWHLDSQQDFSARLFARRVVGKQKKGGRARVTATPLHLPGRWSHLAQTAPTYLGPEAPSPWAFPSRSHAPGEGELRPQLWTEPEWPAGSTEPPRFATEKPPRPKPPPRPKTPPHAPGRRIKPKGVIPRHIPGPPGQPRRRPGPRTRPPSPPPLPEPGPGAPPVIRDRTAWFLGGSAPQGPPASLTRERLGLRRFHAAADPRRSGGRVGVATRPRSRRRWPPRKRGAGEVRADPLALFDGSAPRGRSARGWGHAHGGLPRVMFSVAPDLGRGPLFAPGLPEPKPSPPPQAFGGVRLPNPDPLYYLGGGPRVGALVVARFPEQLDGVAPSQVRLEPKYVSTRYYAGEDGTAHANLGPGTLRAWFRFDELPPAGQRAYLFDGGEDIHRDRVSLYLDGPGQLVLAVHDEALDVLESGGKPRAAKVVYAPDQPFQEGNWYHVACFWKGSDRGDLALMVDGQLVGHETHGSRLAEAVDEFTNVLVLEDATDFPPSGWVRIGQSRWRKPNTVIASPSSAGGTAVRSPGPVVTIRAGQWEDRGIANSPFDVSERVEVLRYVRKDGHKLILERALPEPYRILPNETPRVVRRWDPDATKWLKATRTPARQPQRVPRRGSGHPFEFIYAPSSGGGGPRRLSARLGFPHDKGTFVVPYGYHSRVRNGVAKKKTPASSGGTSVPQPAAGAGGAAAAAPAPAKKDVIRRGGARLRQPLARHTPASLLYQPVRGFDPNGDTEPEVLDAATTSIPVLAISADWPPMGIVRITSRKSGHRSVERILYRKLNRAARALEDCVRGVEGTSAAPHHLFDPVVLESITISDASDYPERETLKHGRVYVSLGGGTGPDELPEWLSIQRPQDRGLELLGLVLIPPVDSLDAEEGALPPYAYRADLVQHMIQRGGDLGADPGGLPILNPQPGDAGSFAQHLLRWETFSAARGQKGSARPQLRHEAGTKVIPTFAVRAQDAYESGRGDVVTVADDQAQATPPRQELRIAHAALAVAAGSPGDRLSGWLIAFDDFPARSYEGAHNARLARWPVGNLHAVPELVFGRRALPPEASDSGGGEGTFSGRVDDLVSMQLSEHVFAFPIPVEAKQGLSLRHKQVDLGIYLVDQEVIAVTRKQKKFRRHDLIDLRRGVLGSTAATHSDETPGWRLDWPLVAVVGFVPKDHRQPIRLRTVRRHAALKGVSPRDGYLALDRGMGDPYVEVRPYTQFSPNELQVPRDVFGRRAFRSAFGSGRADLRPGDLLVDLPVRVHDRYAERVDSLQGVFFQASRPAWGARVDAVAWDEQLPNPYAEVKVALRVDGAPSWSAAPVTAQRELGTPGLYLFDDPKQPNRVGLRADQLALRVYMTFKPQAFYRDAWKQPVRVGAVRVRYRQPTRTLRREERVE